MKRNGSGAIQGLVLTLLVLLASVVALIAYVVKRPDGASVRRAYQVEVHYSETSEED